MRRIVSIILAIAMMFSTVVPVTAASLGGFTDIPDDPSKEAVLAAISNRLMGGSGNRIMPEADLKRCEMAAIINRAFGATQKGDISKYTDIPSDKWYVDDMAKAVRMRTFIGYENLMRPEDPITRQEAFAVLARILKLSASDNSPLNIFTDKADISDWAKPAIAAFAVAGYIDGSKGKLNPLSNISRAEFAQIMHNIIKTYIKTAGTYTKVADGSVMINAPGVTLKGVAVKGDLIIGEGVGTGSVTLDAAVIEGRTIIRGGGKNSVHIINGTTIIGTVIIDNVNNEIRIVTDQGTTIQKIESGSQVALEGSFGEVKVVAGPSGGFGAVCIEVKGAIQSMSIESTANVKVTGGTVASITVAKSASGTVIEANAGAAIGSVVANAQANITGSGTVGSVKANANNIKVDTKGTNVTAAQGVTGVTAGEREVPAGTTVTIPTATPPESSGGSSGDSGGGSGSSSSDWLSNGYNGNYTVSRAGTYGPASGSGTVTGNITVNVANVTLRNLVIAGNLTFSAGIGNGNAYMSNVTVQGKTIVQGGGSNSIHIEGASDPGIIEVDDKRSDQSVPINISAGGTGIISAVNVKSESPVKITPLTDTIQYIAAVNGSKVVYVETEHTNALLDRIVQKADYVLDNAFVGQDDTDFEISPGFDALVSDIIDEATRNTQFYQDYKVAFLKYYINPLDKAEARLDEYTRLTEKLSAKCNTAEIIRIREDNSLFNEHMYDQRFPSPEDHSVLYVDKNLGTHQLDINNLKEIYDRATGNLGLGDPGEAILNKLKELQTVSALYSVVILDEDGSGDTTVGDKIAITFKRQISEAGKLAFQGISPSAGSFGGSPVYFWDLVEIADFSGTFNVSRCTITLGENPVDFRGATLTIPKEEFGSIRPAGVPLIGMLTHWQPAFDIVITLANSEASGTPPGGGEGPAPAVQSITVVDAVYSTGHGEGLAVGDLIAIKFDKSLSFDQMDGITLAFAEEGNVFGIPGGVYSNRNEVPGVEWSDDETTVIIALQSGFSLDFTGANTIDYTSGNISVNETVSGFTDGISAVIVEENATDYDVTVIFINPEDNAGNSDLKGALALALDGDIDESGSNGTSIRITGVPAGKLGTEITLLPQHTYCNIGFGFIA